ncbi:MAG: cytochrome c oxidase subunit 3 family protein [Phycisphaerales bacterium]|nr:cytochrome c oxidase subunit 3 family protein [Phycisphaerales bacterium]
MSQVHIQGDEHGHDHPEFLAHHWSSPVQQFEAGKLGMWLFLATEILLFGGLFVAYAVWRSNHPEIFAYGSQFLDTTWGAINTAVLLTSSMTMAMAVTFAARGKMKAVVVTLILTLMGAGGFMAIKYVEYSHKFHEGFYPGLSFYEEPEASHLWLPLEETAIAHKDAVAAHEAAGSAALAAEDAARAELPAAPAEAQVWNQPKAGLGPEGLTTDQELLDTAELAIFLPPSVLGNIEDQHEEVAFAEHHAPGEQVHLSHPLQDPERPVNAQKFFTIYFLMTGLHGIHVVVGGIVILWLLILTLRGRFSRKYYTPVDLGGLYWHIVDVIWIFLFPLFYLI